MRRTILQIVSVFVISFATLCCEAKAHDGISVSAHFSTKKAYAGECVNYIVELEVGHNDQFDNIYILNEPTIDGLKQVGRKSLDYSEGRFDRKSGRRTITIMYDTYIPTQTGECSVRGGKLLVEMLVPTVYNHPFWGSIESYTTRDVEIDIPDAKLKSAKLPADRSGKYSGLVGDFTFTPQRDTVNVEKGIEFTMIYTLEGSGCIPDSFVADFKSITGNGIQLKSIYPKSRSYYRGGKLYHSVNYLVTCIAADYGNYPLPSLSVTCFNPDTGKYSTIQAPGVTIEVKSNRNVDNMPGRYVWNPFHSVTPMYNELTL